jgi:hypothetical protein
MDGFLHHNYVVYHLPFFDEATFIGGNEKGEDGFKMVGDHLRDDFIRDIANGNGEE